MGAWGEVDWMGRVPLVTPIGFGGVLLKVRKARRDDKGGRAVERGVKTRGRKAPPVTVLNIDISLQKYELEVSRSFVGLFVDEEER